MSHCQVNFELCQQLGLFAAILVGTNYSRLGSCVPEKSVCLLSFILFHAPNYTSTLHGVYQPDNYCRCSKRPLNSMLLVMSGKLAH